MSVVIPLNIIEVQIIDISELSLSELGGKVQGIAASSLIRYKFRIDQTKLIPFIKQLQRFFRFGRGQAELQLAVPFYPVERIGVVCAEYRLKPLISREVAG